jgi:hypothetical protein
VTLAFATFFLFTELGKKHNFIKLVLYQTFNNLYNHKTLGGLVARRGEKEKVEKGNEGCHYKGHD